MSIAFSPSPSIIISVFIHSLFFTCHGFHSFFFFIQPTYLHPFGQPFTFSLLGEFQAWYWLWYQMLWSQRCSRGPGCARSRNLVSNVCTILLFSLPSAC